MSRSHVRKEVAMIFDFGWWPSVRHPDPSRMARRMQSQATELSPSREIQVDFWRSWATYFAEAADQSFAQWKAEKKLNDGKVNHLENELVSIKRSMESYETTITALHEKDQKNREYIESLQNQLKATSHEHVPTAQEVTIPTPPATPEASSWSHRGSDTSIPQSPSRCQYPTDESRSLPPVSTPTSAPTSSVLSPFNFPAKKRVIKTSGTPHQMPEATINSSKSELSSVPTQSKLAKVEELFEKIQANDTILHQLSKDTLSTRDAQLKYQATETNFTINQLRDDLSKQRESYVHLRGIVRKMEKRLLQQTMTIKEMRGTIKDHEAKESEQGGYICSLEQRVGHLYMKAQTADELSITCSDATTSVSIEPKDGGVVVLPKTVVDGFLAALGVDGSSMAA